MSTINRFPIFAALDVEWRRFATSDRASAAVARWRRGSPVLEGLRSVDDVLSLRRDASLVRDVLRELVRRAATDPEAARVVLQALVPGLVRIASSYADDDPESAAGDVVALAWERICSYPNHRPGDVAGNLLLDIRKQMGLDRRPLGDVGSCRVGRSAEDEALERIFFAELGEAERAQVGDDGSFRLIVASRVMGHRLVDLAAARGEGPQALVMRRSRAERRLRRHLSLRDGRVMPPSPSKGVQCDSAA